MSTRASNYWKNLAKTVRHFGPSAFNKRNPGSQMVVRVVGSASPRTARARGHWKNLAKTVRHFGPSAFTARKKGSKMVVRVGRQNNTRPATAPSRSPATRSMSGEKRRKEQLNNLVKWIESRQNERAAARAATREQRRLAAMR
jgi:hypothetical protein